MMEEAEYNVTLNLKISANILFSEVERDMPLAVSDAIENAICCIPQEVFAELEAEGFSVAYPITGEAFRIDVEDK